MISLTNKEVTITISAFVLVGVYSVLPSLINHYNFPSGDDPYYYLVMIDSFPGYSKYYGAVPGKWLGLTEYYYLTPLLVLTGLYIILRRYSIWCPILVWTTLFFITAPILQDMEAGTFVGIIGFYTVSLPLLYLTTRSSNIRLCTLLLPITIAFHTVSGAIASIGYIGTSVADRKPLKLLALVPLVALAAYLGVNHSSSLAQIARIIPFIDTPNLDYQMQQAPGDFTYRMPLNLFAKHYLGASTIALVGVSGLMFYNALKRGLRPKLDPFVLSLILLCVILPVFIFTDLQINSDRTAKFLVGILVILSSIALVVSLKHLNVKFLNTRLLNYSTVVFILLLLIVTVPKKDGTLSYWLSAGAFKCINTTLAEESLVEIETTLQIDSLKKPQVKCVSPRGD